MVSVVVSFVFVFDRSPLIGHIGHQAWQPCRQSPQTRIRRPAKSALPEGASGTHAARQQRQAVQAAQAPLRRDAPIRQKSWESALRDALIRSINEPVTAGCLAADRLTDRGLAVGVGAFRRGHDQIVTYGELPSGRNERCVVSWQEELELSQRGTGTVASIAKVSGD